MKLTNNYIKHPSDILNIGDIVMGEKLVQHDFDVTSFGREKGFIPEIGKYFENKGGEVSTSFTVNTIYGTVEIENFNVEV